MADQKEFKRQVRRTAFLTVGLAAALVFGIIVLVSGDWIPGTIIVVATVVGLAEQVPGIRRLCSEESSPSPPRHKPAH
jgi:predicted tellurium resistance membrane protein TerC